MATIWQEINKKLEEEVEELKNYLVNGHCSEYYSYREVVGKIDGLNKSKEIFHDFMKKYVEEEE